MYNFTLKYSAMIFAKLQYIAHYAKVLLYLIICSNLSLLFPVMIHQGNIALIHTLSCSHTWCMIIAILRLPCRSQLASCLNLSDNPSNVNNPAEFTSTNISSVLEISINHNDTCTTRKGALMAYMYTVIRNCMYITC